MEPREKALEVHRRLLEIYGDCPKYVPKAPLDELINTILSQNTNDRNRDLAYARLRERFPTWEAVRDAPLAAVTDLIRPAGLSTTKAPRIQEALRRITAERGALNLDFLRQMPVDEARRWLTGLKGVGPKTAAIVLLFTLGMPAFPVDTHIHRVTRRLGLIPPRTSREKAHELLEALVPPRIYRAFHLNLIEHGRHTCRARRPQCESCALRDLCDARAEGVLAV